MILLLFEEHPTRFFLLWCCFVPPPPLVFFVSLPNGVLFQTPEAASFSYLAPLISSSASQPLFSSLSILLLSSLLPKVPPFLFCFLSTVVNCPLSVFLSRPCSLPVSPNLLCGCCFSFNLSESLPPAAAGSLSIYTDLQP